MWPRLAKQIAAEREMLNGLLADHRTLMDKCELSSPEKIEISALAAMLHSFYTGIENLFERIAIELDEGLPQGPAWHKELLARMSLPAPRRPAVISPGLAESLREYLEFRHFFRGAYTFQVLWDRMAHLVQSCPVVLKNLEDELDVFIEAMSGNESP